MQALSEWSFQIRLAETAGASTRVTALKFNGADYSSSIAAWFGSGDIAANGAIVAPLRGSGRSRTATSISNSGESTTPAASPGIG